MKLFRPAGAEKDRLFLVTKRHHAMILEVENSPDGGKDFEIVTRAYGDVRDRIGKKSQTGTIAVAEWSQFYQQDQVLMILPVQNQTRETDSSHVGLGWC